jgi:hypothetical protein
LHLSIDIIVVSIAVSIFPILTLVLVTCRSVAQWCEVARPSGQPGRPSGGGGTAMASIILSMGGGVATALMAVVYTWYIASGGTTEDVGPQNLPVYASKLIMVLTASAALWCGAVLLIRRSGRAPLIVAIGCGIVLVDFVAFYVLGGSGEITARSSAETAAMWAVFGLGWVVFPFVTMGLALAGPTRMWIAADRLQPYQPPSV